ncbi:MAG: hypothetical protein KDK33_00200 [Leptospiraceae bacterium]|nr:hypothetical protein [Leptospiraceae bacterium]
MMQIGKPVLDYPVIAQVPISTAEFQKRLRPYLSRVRRTGVPEMEKIFDSGPRGHGIIFKKRAVDYYFVAVHGPPFGRCHEDIAANLLSIMTFVTFPFRSICTSHTEILIMDSNFEQVGELNASTETELSSAWWYYFLDSIPGVREPMDAHALDRSLFRSDIYKLEAELLRIGVRGEPPIESEEYHDSQE